MPVRYPFGTSDYQRQMVAVAGTAFFVDSGHAQAEDSPSHGRTPEVPFATIDYAIGRCAADNGDVIFVMPGHAETTTVTIALDIAGVSIIGLGVGRSRPAVTANFAATGVTVTVSAANCLVKNIRLVASSAAQTNQVSVLAADFEMTDCVIEQGANNLIGVNIGAGAARPYIHDCLWLGTANGPDVALDFPAAGGGDNCIVEDCEFNAGLLGWDLGVIRAGRAVEGGLFQRLTILGVDTVAIDFNSSSAAAGDGMVADCRFLATAALTSIEDILDVGGYSFFECYAADAVSAAAARVPLLTVS